MYEEARHGDHGLSHRATVRRFDDPGVAARYAHRKNRPTRRNLRELTCILDALTGVPAGARVLDLPCGTGRLIVPLRRRGWRLVAADYSEHMLAEAECRARADADTGDGEAGVEFRRVDVLDTGFESGAFDAVICNRLLHHYPEASLRRRALGELSRICRGPVVVSYFSNVSLSAMRFHLSHWLLRRPKIDRVPIWPEQMRRDAAEAGLRWVSTHPVRFGLSPQTYVHLEAPGN